jgi:hypothetical protein
MGTKTATTTPTGISSGLFGAARQAVLGLLFENADRRFYLRQIVGRLGLGTGVVQRELLRLTRCGILVRTVEGRQTYYQANPHCPVFSELRGLVRKTLGVAGILRAALEPLAGRIRVAFLYGSMASGQERVSSDVDVMVIGDALSVGEVVSALSEAQRQLGREVNPSVYSTAEFSRKASAGQHFLRSVLAGPRILLIGDENELAGVAKARLARAASDQRSGDRRSLRRG